TTTAVKANQTIAFGALGDKIFGDADFAVSATVSSSLGVSFAASGNCTVSGTTVHITGAGSCTITASQGGDANYNAAPNVQQSFNIAQASTSTALTSSGSPSILGQTVTFTATVSPASVTGTVGFYDNGSLLGTQTLSGNIAVYSTSLAAGTHPITVTYNGNSNYSASTSNVVAQRVDTPPAAQDGSASVAHRSSSGVNITLSANDADGDSLTYSLIGANGGAAHGTVTISGSTARYTPTASADFVGMDTFQWKANDGIADSNTATITVTLSNSAPSATLSLNTSSPRTTDVLTATATRSDSDADAVTLTFVWKKFSGGITSTVKTTANTTSLTDTLDLSVAGNGDHGDNITVEVTPDDGHTNGATVSLSAVVINTAPTATADAYNVNEDNTLVVSAPGVLSNDSDVDGDALSAISVSGPSHG
ncbi:MAG: Ig-like domain repeat protein, partial [Chloroflexi bacterium]|nr:Ig-like domain repeat protein [Chloroflexota bacterium]